MADLETLTLQINAESAKATSAIGKLAKRLDDLSISIAKLETGKLNDLAYGLNNLNAVIYNMNATTSKWDYNRIVTNISTLSSVNTAGLDALSLSLGNLTGAITSLSGVTSAADNIKSLILAIGKLGSKSVDKSIENIPKLETSLQHLIKTFSSLPNINQSIIDFVNSLANLSAQGSRVGSASRSINSSLQSFERSADRATKKSRSLASAIGTLYAKFWLAMRAARGLKNAFKDAADYLEAYNYFDVTAQKIGKETFLKAGEGSAEQYAQAFTETLQRKLKQMSGLELDLEDRLIKTTNAKSLGLNLTELTQYQASIASITNAMGVSQEIAQSTSKAFSMLAADMGSLKNLDFETVASNLQSGLTGQARALYKFGIDITNATLEQYAYAEGINKSVSEMTQAEKAQVRLLAILDQSKVAWGDLAHTINSPSNQLRQLKNNLKEVGTVMGQLFIPIMQRVLPVLNGVSIAIKQLLVDIAGILGIKLDLESFGDGWADSLDEDTDALNDLDKQLKKTKKGIREFDELKVIGEKSTGDAGLGDQIDLTQQILDATAEYERVWDEAYEKMRSKAQEIADLISPIFDPIKKIVEDFNVGDFFKAGEDVSGLVKSIFDFFTRALQSVDWHDIGVKIGEFFKGIDWLGIFKSVGKLIGTALQSAFDLWTGSFSVAPFETAIITAFALLKFTGLGSMIKGSLAKAVSKQLTANGISKELSSVLGKFGVISLGIGLAITIDNVKHIKEGEYSAFSLKGLLKSMISSLFTGAGIALLASSIGIASGAFAFGIGAAISLLVNLAVTGAAMETPYEAAKKVVDAEYQWVEDNELNRMEILTNIELQQGEIDTQFLQIDDLADKVYELSLNYDKLTDGEKGLLKYYSDELIKVMPELANQIDTVTGAYKGTREELDKLIVSQKKQMMLEAYKKDMSQLIEGIASAEHDIDELSSKRSDNARKLTALRDKFKEYMGEDFTDELWSYVVQSYKIENEGRDLSYIAPEIEPRIKQKALMAIYDDIDSLGDLIGALAESDTIREGLDTTSKTLEELNRQYSYYEDKLVDTIEDGNKRQAEEQKKSKLPSAVGKTIDSVEKKISDGKQVTKNEMWSMFNGINESFNGLGDGKVPAEVQSTMDNIKKAIEENSPELINYMADLKIQMEKAFANAHYDSSGELIWNPYDITQRIEANFKSIEGGVATADVTSVYKKLKDNLKEAFDGTIPKSVNDSLTKVEEAIKTGQQYKVHSALEELADDVYVEGKKIGRNIVIGGIDGEYSGRPELETATRNTMSGGVVEPAKDEVEVNSPSRVFEEIGKNVVKGAEIGITDETPSLVKVVKSMANSMSAVFGGTKLNIPSLDLNNNIQTNVNNSSKSYSNDNSLFDRMAMNMQGQGQQTEVVFRIEGDPHGMFKVIRQENEIYRNRTNRSAFA